MATVLTSFARRPGDARQGMRSDCPRAEVLQGLIDIRHGSLNQRQEKSAHPDNSKFQKL